MLRAYARPAAIEHLTLHGCLLLPRVCASVLPPRRYAGPTPSVTYAFDAAAINAQTAILNKFKVCRVCYHVVLRRSHSQPLNVCLRTTACIHAVCGGRRAGVVTDEQLAPGSAIARAGARCC